MEQAGYTVQVALLVVHGKVLVIKIHAHKRIIAEGIDAEFIKKYRACQENDQKKEQASKKYSGKAVISYIYFHWYRYLSSVSF